MVSRGKRIEKRGKRFVSRTKNDTIMPNDFFYRKVIAYQLSIKLTDYVYRLVDGFPPYEQFALSNQLRRAVVSVSSNIAEGTGRFSLKERIHFMDIAYGSTMETMCQLEIAHIRHYISDEAFQKAESMIQETSRTLFGFRNSLVERLNKQL